MIAIGRHQQLAGRIPPAGDEHARNIVAEGGRKDVHATGRVEALEVANFAFAEDQDARRLQIRIEACECQAGFLDVRAGDRPFETGCAAEELERKADRFRPAVQEASDRYRSRGHQASGSINPRLPSARRNSTLISSVDELRNTRNASRPSATSMAASSTDIGFTA